MRFFSFFLLQFLLLASTAFAKDVLAFVNGVPQANYDQLISSVQPGDTLTFQDHGRKTIFTIKSQIYPSPAAFAGSQNILFELNDGRALRVPRTSEHLESIHEFISGYDDLAGHGIRFMKVDVARSKPGIYVIHEKLPIQFTLSDFLKSSPMGSEFKGVNTNVLKEQLRQFGEKLANFEELGDFELTQVGWVKGRWVLFDYGHPHYQVAENFEETIFSPYARAKLSSLSRDGQAIMRDMDAYILAKRRHLSSRCEALYQMQ